MYGKSTRGRKKVYNDDNYSKYELGRLEDELAIPTISDEIFGRVVNEPYLHYLVSSRIDYKIHRINANSNYKSIVVRNPIVLKGQYGFYSRIFLKMELYYFVVVIIFQNVI